MPKMLRLLWTAALLAAPAAPVAAAFAENFEVDSTAFWTVNNGPSDARCQLLLRLQHRRHPVGATRPPPAPAA